MKQNISNILGLKCSTYQDHHATTKKLADSTMFSNLTHVIKIFKFQVMARLIWKLQTQNTENAGKLKISRMCQTKSVLANSL